MLKKKLRSYWTLTKSLQTILLLITGLAGFMSSRCPWLNVGAVLQVGGSLFLAISGTTILNMWYDRDIDSVMGRSCQRPLPQGDVSSREALILGTILVSGGIIWALALDLLYGVIVFAGLFFDFAIYTLWLKRRSAWSIVWGGISGGMPILAGRAFGLGGIDWIGLMLALAVLFWIPTHIMTFSIKYHEDYKRAGVPTFPAAYGFNLTRRIVALSSLLSALAMGTAAVGIGMTIGYLRLMGVLSFGLLMLAASSLVRPSDRVNLGLFKYASVYMLSSMLLIAFVVL